MASFLGFVKWTIVSTIRLLLVAFLALFLSATIPFYDVNPKPYNIPFPKFEGPLSENKILSFADHLFEGQINGPESIAVWKDELYTSSDTGEILRIRDGKISRVAHVRPNPVKCEGPWEMDKCGRPLGMKFDSKGTLYVIEPYRGLLSVDVEKGEVKTLLEAGKRVDGKPLLFLDDLAIDEDSQTGELTFYLSDASGRWPLRECFLSVVEHDLTGRLIKFELSSRKTTTIADGLGFPNGVELTDDRQAILFAEVNTRRITKYFIRGPNAGKSEIFAADLPGEPDNIRRSADKSRETYWVAVAYARREPGMGDVLADKAAIRRGLLRLNYAIAKAFNFLADLSGFLPFRELGDKLERGVFLLKIVHLYGMVLELDASGRIIQSLHSPDASTTLISEVREVVEGPRRTLYLGSVANNYLGKLVLD